MTFSQFGYRKFHNENKEKWPLQPSNIENWRKMVNDDEKYCSKMNWLKWIELYFYKAIGRIKQMSDLPSCHEYWKLEIEKRKNKKKTR